MVGGLVEELVAVQVAVWVVVQVVELVVVWEAIMAVALVAEVDLAEEEEVGLEAAVEPVADSVLVVELVLGVG